MFTLPESANKRAKCSDSDFAPLFFILNNTKQFYSACLYLLLVPDDPFPTVNRMVFVNWTAATMKDKDVIVFLILCTRLFAAMKREKPIDCRQWDKGQLNFKGEWRKPFWSVHAKPKGDERKYVCAQTGMGITCTIHTQKNPGLRGIWTWELLGVTLLTTAPPCCPNPASSTTYQICSHFFLPTLNFCLPSNSAKSHNNKVWCTSLFKKQKIEEKR